MSCVMFRVMHSADTVMLFPVHRYLLIVEKDAIFQRLAEGGLHNQLPCILVTAKGMPDLATRALCAKLVVRASR
jgi:DNA topoisomerase VI subunit A